MCAGFDRLSGACHIAHLALAGTCGTSRTPRNLKPTHRLKLATSQALARELSILDMQWQLLAAQATGWNQNARRAATPCSEATCSISSTSIVSARHALVPARCASTAACFSAALSVKQHAATATCSRTHMQWCRLKQRSDPSKPGLPPHASAPSINSDPVVVNPFYITTKKTYGDSHLVMLAKDIFKTFVACIVGFRVNHS